MGTIKGRRQWGLVVLLLLLAAGPIAFILLPELDVTARSREQSNPVDGAELRPSGGSAAGEEEKAAAEASQSEATAVAAELAPYGDHDLPRQESIRGVVLDLEGKPVADAEVRAAYRDTNERPFLVGETGRVRSEPDGFFVLGPLDRRSYAVLAIKEGQGIAHESGQMPGCWVELVLGPGAAVTGRVTVRESGKPVPDALVIAKEGELRFDARTDAEGKYTLDLLPPTRNTWSGHEILIIADGYQRASRNNLLLVSGDAKNVDFALDPGKSLKGRVVNRQSLKPVAGALVSEGWEPYDRAAETDKDGRYLLEHVDVSPNLVFGVQADGFLSQQRQSDGSGVLEFELESSVVLEGRVYAPDETVAKGARVYLHRIQHAPGYKPTGSSRAQRRMETDENGVFRFTDVLPGKVAVVAFHDEYAPGEYGPIELQLGVKPPGGIDVTLKEGVTVQGEVRDAQNQPLPAIQVRMQRWGYGGRVQGYKWINNYVWREVPTFYTDAAGKFELRGGVPGKHWLGAYDKTLGWSGTQLDGQEGQRVTDLIISFAGASITGTVTTADGRPLPGAYVNAQGPKGTPNRGWRWTPTDGLGRFKLGGLKEGLYDIQANSTFGQPKPLKDIPAGTQGVELKLEVVQTLTGVVSSALTGRPLEQFKLGLQKQQKQGNMVRHVGGDTREIRSPDGCFEKPVQPGTYTLTVSAAGHAPQVVRDVVIEELAAPQPLYLTLDAGGGVHGTVTDREGKPLRNAWIYATVHRAPGETADPVDNLLQVHDRADSKGRYFLQGMAPGTYLIQLNMGNRGSIRAQVIVQGLETIRQDLQLMPTGSVMVRALDEEGKPVQGVYFYFFDDANQWLGWGRQTDSDGFSLAQNLRMGPAMVQAHHTKYKAERFPITIRPDAQVSLEVTLRKKEE